MSQITDKSNEKVKISDHIFKYVEYELYSYRAYKAAISELEQDLKEVITYSSPSPSDFIPSRTGPGDPVSLTALRTMVIEEKIRDKAWRIRKIEAGLSLLNSDERDLLERKYLCGIEFTNEQIIVQMCYNRNYFYKLRNDIIYKFAIVFGVL